jgi:hypothetical protein
MTNPIVLICTHNRLEITSYNIVSLLNQSVKPKIVLVVSSLEEKIYYRKKFIDVHVIRYANVPLGAKWQYGVNEAFQMQANPLIILGSDDILSPGYIETCSHLTGLGHDFIGLYHWFIHYKGRAFHCQYLANQPLGGARSYSYDLLKKLDGKLFDDRLNRHLDDYAVKKLKELYIPCHSDSALQVHAIKGDWPVMNNFNPNHPNIKILSEHKSSDFFQDLP